MKNLAQQTQLEAYYGIDNIGAKQEQVYKAIETLGRAADFDIANLLQLPINRVTGRRNELVRMGIVKEGTREVSPHTGKRVIYWEVAEHQEPEHKITGRIKKTKKGYFHIECGGRMKINNIVTDMLSGDVLVKKVLVCECKYEHELE